MLFYALYLESLNIFLYTWRFLDQFRDSKRDWAFKWFRWLIVWIVPLIYFFCQLSIVLFTGRYFQLRAEQGDSVLTLHYLNLSVKAFKIYGYWAAISNFFSCTVIILTIRHVK